MSSCADLPIELLKKFLKEYLPQLPILIVYFIFVSLSLFARKVLLGTAYIPPNSNHHTYQLFADAVDEACSTGNYYVIVLTGDFNQPQTNWEDPSSSFLSSNSWCLMDMANLHNLKQ